MIDELESAPLATTQKQALTTRKRKKAELAAAQPTVLERLNDLSVDETFNLLTLALRKDDADRTDVDLAIINGVDSFKRDLAQKVVDESQRRDALQADTIDRITAEQRQVVADIEAIFKASYTSHNNMIERVNAMPDDVAELIASSLAGADPND